jgi:hypothetical protein
MMSTPCAEATPDDSPNSNKPNVKASKRFMTVLPLKQDGRSDRFRVVRRFVPSKVPGATETTRWLLGSTGTKQFEVECSAPEEHLVEGILYISKLNVSIAVAFEAVLCNAAHQFLDE